MILKDFLAKSQLQASQSDDDCSLLVILMSYDKDKEGYQQDFMKRGAKEVE